MTSADDDGFPAATVEQIEAAAWNDPKLANVLYHDWEASDLRREVVDLLRRALHRLRARPVRARGGRRRAGPTRTRARARLRHRLLPAQPRAGGRARRGPRHRPVAAAWSRSRVRNAENPRVRRRGPRRRRRVDPVRRRHLRPRRRARRAAPHPRPRPGDARGAARAASPAGGFVFAGEPTEKGDWVARRLSRLTWWAATRVTQLPAAARDVGPARRPSSTESSRAAALESVVDIHTFDPDRLAALCLRAGAVDVRTVTEELTASWFGWPVRTFEAAVRPGRARAGAGRCSPTAAGSGCRGSTRTCSPGGARRALLQRVRHRHEAGG